MMRSLIPIPGVMIIFLRIRRENLIVMKFGKLELDGDEIWKIRKLKSEESNG